MAVVLNFNAENNVTSPKNLFKIIKAPFSVTQNVGLIIRVGE